MSEPAIVWERRDRVLLITLNRPTQLNALDQDTVRQLNALLVPADKDPALGCVVVTGSEKAFAAGADIKEMQEKSYQAMARDDHFAEWETFARLRTPRIAAVNGYALGGGCELMLMCDFAIAGRSAKFGLPEIKLGVMPGMGGTQRLPRLVGRALAMDLILTGRMMDAAEALAAGLVARLVDDDAVVDTALQAAGTIAGHSKPATLLARDAVNRADEVSLSEGALFERRVFHSLFATDDQREGMSAFAEKRKPAFTGS